MTRKANLIFALSSVTCLMLGFYLGLNFMSWLYFSDDRSVRESIYHDAIESIVTVGTARDRSAIRENLNAMHPDFFRDKESECVRFMPKYGQYGFVRVFCKNITDGSVKISNY